MNYTDINASVIDGWVKEGWEWSIPISHEEYLNAKQGSWNMLLTPTKPVPKHWFGVLQGANVLGLASGGGQQMPIFAALGANCTILDYSPSQLEKERMVAQREGYSIEIVRADMTRPLPFEEEAFDLIFHPVSNCYIQNVLPVWKECFRILKKGGVLLAGLDNGINYLFDAVEEKIVQKLPFNPLEDPALYQASLKNDDGIQFSHTIEEQVGGQLQAGFILTDIYHDTNGCGKLHEHNAPTFYATRAIKPTV